MTTRVEARPTNGIWVADDDSQPYLSAEVIPRPPIKLLLSLVGRCNLRCFHCLGTSEELVRSSQDGKSASRELVDFVAEQVLPEVRAIRLGGVGLTEQLTSRTFEYFMERVEPHAPRLGSFELITNLSVMTEQRADLLARSLTDVQVSIEGVEDNFTRLRGLPWPRLVKHFRMLREAKARHPASRMKITLLACAMSDMLDDLLRFDVFESLGVESIIVRELVPIAPHHEARVLHREPEKTRAFIREFHRRALAAGIEPIVTIADRYDPDGPALLPRGPEPPFASAAAVPAGDPALRRCTLPFEVLTVVHTGQFGVCCYITDLAGPAPDLSALSIMDVWNSPGFVALRRTVNSSAPPLTCLSCEVKVGHLGETEKSLARAEAKLHFTEEERARLGQDLHALREHVQTLEADRAARLDVIHAQGRQLGEIDAARNLLRAEVAALEGHLAAAEADRAARLDVIHAQGRQLADATARLGEQERRLHALASRLAALRATRVYRLLRRFGRWQFIEETVAEMHEPSPPDP